MSTEWNAFDTLRIYPQEPGFHCMGHAKTTSDGCCHNPIAQANRKEASSILDDMCAVEPMSTESRQLLHLLAPIILCKRYHRDQEDKLYLQLRRRMRRASTPEAVTGGNTTVVITSGWRPRRSIQSQSLAAPAPVQRQSSRNTHPSSRPPIVPSSPPALQNPPQSSSQQTSTTHSTTTTAIHEASVHTPTPQPTSRARPRSHESVIRATTATNVPSCTVRHARRRALAEECPVCTLPMEMSEGLTWCKAKCGQNFHMSCFKLWEEQQRGDGTTVLCGYWYVSDLCTSLTNAC